MRRIVREGIIKLNGRTIALSMTSETGVREDGLLKSEEPKILSFGETKSRTGDRVWFHYRDYSDILLKDTKVRRPGGPSYICEDTEVMVTIGRRRIDP